MLLAGASILLARPESTAAPRAREAAATARAALAAGFNDQARVVGPPGMSP